ncbi:MAG: hypothetical protein AMXMBFR13_13310 [Phycisphaerae bacterium]
MSVPCLNFFAVLMLMTGIFLGDETRPSGSDVENFFFALDTATKDAAYQSYEAQAAMLKELGYAGWGPSGEQNVPEMLKALDAHGLKMFALYTGLNIDPEGPAYDPKLKDTLAALKERKTILWVFVTSKKHKPSSTDGDERAVALLREVADLAHEAGLRVAIYPHFAFYVEKTDDAVRLARKANRRNLGVTFNLCHWLRSEPGQDLLPLLRRAMPYLFVVTINGADREGTDWGRLIQPLGEGDYDVYGLLTALRNLGFEGPIGFQGYGIKGDVHAVLKKTMDAWREYQRRLAEEQRPRR